MKERFGCLHAAGLVNFANDFCPTEACFPPLLLPVDEAVFRVLPSFVFLAPRVLLEWSDPLLLDGVTGSEEVRDTALLQVERRSVAGSGRGGLSVVSMFVPV